MASSIRPLRQLDDPEIAHEARRAFIEATFDLIDGKDELDFSVADVVRRSGWHNASFYRLFGSKDGLLLAVAAEAAQQTSRALEKRVGREADLESAVRTWARVLLRLAAAPRSAAAVQAFSFARHQLARRFPEANDELTLPIKGVLLNVLMDAGISDFGAITDAAYDLVMGQQATWLACRHRPSPEEIERTTEMMMRLMRGTETK
jgi:AcrR family transcriptional regulator